MRKFIALILTLVSLNADAQSLMKEERIDDDAHFYFYGSSSVNTTEELVSSISGTQSFSLRALLKKINPEKNDSRKGWGLLRGVNLDLAINALNLRPTGIPKDSIDIVSLMFPETGNSGFMVNLNWIFFNNGNQLKNYRMGVEASMSLRQSKINTTVLDSSGNESGAQTVNFSALNYTLMPYFTYIYDKEDDFRAFISVGMPIGFMNIPNEDVSDFIKLFPYDENMFIDRKKSSITSIGARFSAGINDFLFFIDMRQSLDTKNLNDENPFKGFIYNFGFASKIAIFKK